MIEQYSCRIDCKRGDHSSVKSLNLRHLMHNLQSDKKATKSKSTVVMSDYMYINWPNVTVEEEQFLYTLNTSFLDLLVVDHARSYSSQLCPK